MEHNNQLFEFIVVIDFEATCDQAENPTVTRENQEIIEFPWVVLNTSNLDIVDEGQIYCKPEWTKELTPFCTKLTGITNETIAQKGILLKDAIKKFDDYIATNIGSRSFCILTDGDWDIKTCLLREAIKKNISLDDHYYRYLNLKSLFLDAASNPTLRAKIFSETSLPANTQIPSRPSLGFMLSALQLEFEGHQHSGIDDCKNIARVVQRLIKHGVSMNDYVIIPRNFNPAEETVPDFNVTKNNINDPSEMSLVPSKVIRLRGVPFRATKQDIIDFLRVNITEDKVHILKNMWNKPSGAVLVMFDSIEEAEEAMKQDKQYMGTRYIEIHYRKYEPTSEEQVIDKMQF